MDGWTIRPARESDADLVGSISAEAYLPAYLPIIGTAPEPAFEDYGPWIERGAVWLLEAAGEIAGVMVLESRPDHLLVYSVAVRPEHQRRGYGRTLLTFAETLTVEAGLGELRLYTNRRMTDNLRLYRACGFVETGERPHPRRVGEVLVDLAKTLR